MSYEKQTWQTGDVITATKLNHMEDGIADGGGIMLVETTFDSSNERYTSDVLYSDVVTAYESGTHVVVHIPKQDSYSQPEVWLGVNGYKPKDTGMGSDKDFWSFDTSLAGLVTEFDAADGYFIANIYIDSR